jgi:hypothetical protein
MPSQDRCEGALLFTDCIYPISLLPPADLICSTKSQGGFLRNQKSACRPRQSDSEMVFTKQDFCSLQGSLFCHRPAANVLSFTRQMLKTRQIAVRSCAIVTAFTVQDLLGCRCRTLKLCRVLRGPQVPGNVVDVHDGVRVGAAERLCDAQLPGHIQFYGPVPPLGAVGILRGPAEQPRGGLLRHGSRYLPSHISAGWFLGSITVLPVLIPWRCDCYQFPPLRQMAGRSPLKRWRNLFQRVLTPGDTQYRHPTLSFRDKQTERAYS